MSKIRILFWLNRSKMNRELKAPIYLRITVKGKKVEIATGHWIKQNEWDTLKHQAKGNSESSSLINNYLISTKAKILQTQNSFTVAGSPNINAEYVKEKLLGVSPEKKTLLQLFDYHNSQIKEQIGKGFREGTYRHYVVTYNKVKAFLKFEYNVDDFPLEGLSHQFVDAFHYYLKTTQKLSSNTAMKKIKQLKKVISIACNL